VQSRATTRRYRSLVGRALDRRFLDRGELVVWEAWTMIAADGRSGDIETPLITAAD
jgi:hypothetical protein